MAETNELLRRQQEIEAALGRMQGFFGTSQAAQDLQGFFNSPLAQGLQGQLQGRASGAQSPFSPDLIASLIAGSTDANARGVSRDSDMIRRQFANSGLAGSGLEISALVNARRQATSANTQARRDITSRAQLENFQAQERAQAQVQSFLQQRLQAQQQLVESQRAQENQANQAQVNYNSQFREITPNNPSPAGFGGSQGSWVDRWNSAQVQGLTAQANGAQIHGNLQGTPMSATQVFQANAQQANARDRLNQLLAFGG